MALNSRVRGLVVLGAATASVAVPASAGGDETLWENIDPEIANRGHSNATEGVFGVRRTVLDDFVVPDGETWRVTRFHHFHHWNSRPPGSGTGMEIAIWSDEDGRPGQPLFPLVVTGYGEQGTGRTMFNRPEVEAFTELEPFEIGPGHWWFEGTVVGPENNFWNVSFEQPIVEAEHWVNYDDLGFRPGSELWGIPSNMVFELIGTIVCPADLDDSGDVGVSDLLVILAAWGPCANQSGCPEDLDDDGIIGLADLLILLAAWGPCP